MAENVTRRAFLGATATAAVVGPSAALAATAGHPDAALFALAARVEALTKEYNRVTAEIEETEPAFRALMDLYYRERGNEQFSTAYRRAAEETGMEPLARQQGDLCEQIDALYNEIWAIEPQTFEGLAVRALEVRDHASRLWDEPEEDQNWDKVVVRRFVDLALKLGNAPCASPAS